MAKNVSLLGANYPDVPAVDLPKTGGGTARFYDIEPESGSGIINTDNVSSGTVKYRKTGRVVVVYVSSIVAKIRLNGVQTIATGLPNADASDIQLCLCNVTSHKPVRMQINTSGEFKALYDAIEIDENICGTFTYISAS
jgi:hypothetical protein